MPGRAKKLAAAGIKGLAALGYVAFGSIICVSCSGLPLLAGLFGGVAVGTRFGVSAGVVSAVMLLLALMRRRRSRRQEACAVPQARTVPRLAGGAGTAREGGARLAEEASGPRTPGHP